MTGQGAKNLKRNKVHKSVFVPVCVRNSSLTCRIEVWPHFPVASQPLWSHSESSRPGFFQNSRNSKFDKFQVFKGPD